MRSKRLADGRLRGERERERERECYLCVRETEIKSQHHDTAHGTWRCVSTENVPRSEGKYGKHNSFRWAPLEKSIFVALFLRFRAFLKRNQRIDCTMESVTMWGRGVPRVWFYLLINRTVGMSIALSCVALS